MRGIQTTVSCFITPNKSYSSHLLTSFPAFPREKTSDFSSHHPDVKFIFSHFFFLLVSVLWAKLFYFLGHTFFLISSKLAYFTYYSIIITWFCVFVWVIVLLVWSRIERYLFSLFSSSSRSPWLSTNSIRLFSWHLS